MASDPESSFLASLPTIDRIVGVLGARHGLRDADVDEFSSWAKARLIDGDYGILRKFGGRSSLNTYLSVVLANLLKDFCNSRWGRWRPSAAARRIGPLAVRFETLVYRDGYPTREAVEVLKTEGAAESDLRTLAVRIPVRAPAREVTLETAADIARAQEQADMRIREAEEGAEEARIRRIVHTALSELPAEDQILVRMRFWEDFSIADIARALHLEPKPLYRRLEGIQATLGTLLERRGIGREEVAAILTAGGD